LNIVVKVSIGWSSHTQMYIQKRYPDSRPEYTLIPNRCCKLWGTQIY